MAWILRRHLPYLFLPVLLGYWVTVIHLSLCHTPPLPLHSIFTPTTTTTSSLRSANLLRNILPTLSNNGFLGLLVYLGLGVDTLEFGPGQSGTEFAFDSLFLFLDSLHLHNPPACLLTGERSLTDNLALIRMVVYPSTLRQKRRPRLMQQMRPAVQVPARTNWPSCPRMVHSTRLMMSFPWHRHPRFLNQFLQLAMVSRTDTDSLTTDAVSMRATATPPWEAVTLYLAMTPQAGAQALVDSATRHSQM